MKQSKENVKYMQVNRNQWKDNNVALICLQLAHWTADHTVSDMLITRLQDCR